jgi:hypothetical protein
MARQFWGVPSELWPIEITALDTDAMETMVDHREVPPD